MADKSRRRRTNKTVKSVPYTHDAVARTDFTPFGVLNYTNGTKKDLKRLPLPTDDLTRELGMKVYQQMMNDPQVSASTYTASHQVLSQPMTIMPSHPNPDDPGHAKSVEVADFIRRMIDNYGTSGEVFGDRLFRSYYEVLDDALVRMMEIGNSATEIKLKIAKGGYLSGMAVLDSLAVRDPHNYQYVVDRWNNVPYLMCYNGSTLKDKQTYDKSLADGALPTGWSFEHASKFMVLSHRSRYGDPRGTSSLRSAYQSWYLLQNLWPEYHKYLCQFGSPSLKGTTAESAQPMPDVNGKMIKPIDVLYDAMTDYQNGSIIALGFGNEVEMMQPTGEGNAFRLAIETLNNQIVKSILHSVLATSTSGQQTRAASSVHKDISDLPSICLKRRLCLAQKMQIWRPLVALNYGVAIAEEFTPNGSLGRFSPEDLASIISSLAAAGYKLTPTQMASLSADMEIPLPDSQEMGYLMDALESEGQSKQPGLTPGAHDAKDKEAKKTNEKNKEAARN